MTIEMPGGLQEAFSWLGLDWPQADEDKLFAAGDAWTSYAGKLRTNHDNAYKPASTVWSTTTGEATDAFHAWWTANPDQHLPDDADGADLIGAALHAFGAVTIALKLAYIAQLVILAVEIAQAIATAFVSFGATLAEIPAFAAATRVIVKEAIEKAVKEGVQATVKGLIERAKALFKLLAKKVVVPGAKRQGDDLAADVAKKQKLTKTVSDYLTETKHSGTTTQADFDANFPELAGSRINPKFDPLDPSTSENCQSCVQAVHHSLNGTPTVATPRPVDPLTNQLSNTGHFGWPDNVRNALNTGEQFTPHTYESIANDVLEVPGRGGVVFGVRDGSSHVFNVIERNGEAHFVDGQTGGYATLENFKSLYYLRGR